ncbi:MAG TPA: carboxynorspermidine decarboxylase, partial [Saprospiraceae bacterium]|nr:carboxynorspermidine decarboxylase [Saprospiraceae bacterium]
MTNNPDYSSLTGAAYVLHEDKLIRNLELIRSVKEEAGVSIILALKGFAMWRMFPLVAEYLDGATA